MPRRIANDDQDLWDAVARTARPLNARARKKAALPSAIPEPVAPHARAVVPAAAIRPFRIGATAPAAASGIDLAPSLAERFARAPTRLDGHAAARLRRGKSVPEARIDLHGLTLAQAHPALVSFLREAHAAGLRLVLVITGKGREGEDDGPIPVPRGVLRHQLPRWLALPPLDRIVLEVMPSHARHGGGGAWYVCLRRARAH